MAEVKVKITAQNEVATGLQQALTDAKKFGQQATSAVTIDEQAALAPIRKIQSQLAEASKIPAPQLNDQQAVKVALEATGLEQIEQLKAALSEADNKVLRVALEASGLSTAQELRDLLAQAENKTVALALEATGLSSVQELRAALDSAESKVVQLALEATGLNSVQELQSALAQSDNKTVQLALEATGLSSAQELQSAIDQPQNKTVQLALEATGLASAQDLSAALDQAENKSVQLALEATGLSSAEELKDAINGTENKTVRLALQATGFANVQQLEAAIASVESKNIEITAENERALAPLREIQAELRKIRERAGQPIQAPEINASPQEEFATQSTRASSAIRGLAADIANATSPAQVFESVIKRVATAFGGLVAATTGFAIGSVLRNTLEEAAAGLNDLIDRSQALQQSFNSLSAPTTTFDQLATAINGAAEQINALEEANRKLQSGIGFQVADYINSFDLSAAANRETEAGVGNARGALANAILAATQRELELSRARTEEERKLIALQRNRDEFLTKARGLGLERQAQQLFSAQDQDTAAQERLKAEQEISKEKERQAAAAAREAEQEAKRLAAEQQAVSKRRRDFDQQIALSEARLRGDTAAEDDILQQQDIDQVLESGGTFEQAANIAANNSLQRQIDAAMAAQGSGLSGGVGASALQRIGGASNEFFDFRDKQNPTEATLQAVTVLKEIRKILASSEPLVLGSN